jgi:hypothetical protein
LHQQAGQGRGDGNSQVARRAVDADRRTGPHGALQQHRDPDRVVDRCKRADQRERCGQLPRPLRERGQHGAGADAEEEADHHGAAHADGQATVVQRHGTERKALARGVRDRAVVEVAARVFEAAPGARR